MAAKVAAGLLLGLALSLAACDAGQGPSTSNSVALAQIPWCDAPSINFQDDSKLTPVTLTDWPTIKRQLGFTPYLPSTLPRGTCLALAGGSVHDPIFGGRFLITYYLPNSGPLSFSEAPKNANGSAHVPSSVQCSQSAPGATPTPAPTTAGTPAPTSTVPAPLAICLGAVSNTSVSAASAMTLSDLQHMFNGLQADVEWVPQTTKATPSATATSKP